jgi:hypothetical protein
MSHLRAFVQRSVLRRENMAATEVISKIGGQPLSDTLGMHECRRLAYTMRKHPERLKHDLGSKNGLTMRMMTDKGDDVFTLDDGDEVVAYAKLEPGIESRCLYNLYVRAEWRNKGLASVLHLGALHVFKHLESDSTMSMGALKAFKSLAKFGYKIKLRNTKTGETVPFVWGPNDIPATRGKSIEDSENYILYV